MDRLIGCQTPRLASPVEGDTARGDKAVEFARWCGMTLFPWQEDLLRDMCRTREDGLWSYRESVVIVPRQNGKGEVLVARELAGVFLFGEKSILHTAHFLDTAVDARDRLWDFIENNDDLMFWWEGEHDGTPWIVKTNGKEGIKFPNGAEIKFRTRTEKTGRGLSIDLLVFDECFNLPDQISSAISKTTRAKENAHTVYISSPVDQEAHFHGRVFSARRWAGIDHAEGVLFREWSADPDEVDPFSDEAMIMSNPSLVTSGFGASLLDLQADARAAKNSEVLFKSYVVESLGFGNWVPRDGTTVDEFVPIIDYEEWRKLQSPLPSYSETCLSVDVTPDGAAASMVMGLQCDGFTYLALSPGQDFDRDVIADSTLRNAEAHDPVAIPLDPSGPCSTLVDVLRKRGMEPEVVTGGKVSQSYELLLTMIREKKIRHDGDDRWVEALRVAGERSKNGRFRSLDRYSGDVTCLVAASLAVWGLVEFATPVAVADEVKIVKKNVAKARAIRAVKAPEMMF